MSLYVAAILLLCYLWCHGLNFVVVSASTSSTTPRNPAFDSNRGPSNSQQQSSPPPPPPLPVYHLITYATSIFRESAQKLLGSALSKGGFDKVRMYTPADLDDVFVRMNAPVLSEPRGAGFWVWKPYIIFDYMINHAEEGSIVCYMDAGLSPISGRVDLRSWLLGLTAMSPHVNMPAPRPGFGLYKEVDYTKQDAFFLMNVQQPLDWELQVWSGFVVLRNSFAAKRFVSEWLTYSQDERLITDSPAFLTQNSPSFKEHRHDQSVLSILAMKWGVKPFRVPFGTMTDEFPDENLQIIALIKSDPDLLALTMHTSGETFQATVRGLKRPDNTQTLFYFSIMEENIPLRFLNFAKKEFNLDCPSSLVELMQLERLAYFSGNSNNINNYDTTTTTTNNNNSSSSSSSERIGVRDEIEDDVSSSRVFHAQHWEECKDPLRKAIKTQRTILREIISSKPNFLYLYHDNIEEEPSLKQQYEIPTKSEVLGQAYLADLVDATVATANTSAASATTTFTTYDSDDDAAKY